MLDFIKNLPANAIDAIYYAVNGKPVTDVSVPVSLPTCHISESPLYRLNATQIEALDTEKMSPELGKIIAEAGKKTWLETADNAVRYITSGVSIPNVNTTLEINNTATSITTERLSAFPVNTTTAGLTVGAIVLSVVGYNLLPGRKQPEQTAETNENNAAVKEETVITLIEVVNSMDENTKALLEKFSKENKEKFNQAMADQQAAADFIKMTDEQKNKFVKGFVQSVVKDIEKVINGEDAENSNYGQQGKIIPQDTGHKTVTTTITHAKKLHEEAQRKQDELKKKEDEAQAKLNQGKPTESSTTVRKTWKPVNTNYGKK